MWWFLQTLLDNLNAFFAWIMGGFYTLFDYLVTTIINWALYVVYQIQFVICIMAFSGLYIVDKFLQAIISMLSYFFAGSVFTYFGLSKDVMQSYIVSFATVAPNIKSIAYVINFEAFYQSLAILLAFIEFWAFYRWFRVWVRG